MDKPVKLRLKPIVVDAMRYTGDNEEELIAWIRQTNISADYSIHIPTIRTSSFISPTAIVHVEPCLDIYVGRAVVIRMWKNWWIFKDSHNRFSLHDQREVDRKYDLIWPEPLPGV